MESQEVASGGVIPAAGNGCFRPQSGHGQDHADNSAQNVAGEGEAGSPATAMSRSKGWVGREEIRAQEGEAGTQEGTLSQPPTMKRKTELQGQPEKVPEQSELGQESPPAPGSRLGTGQAPASPAHPWPWEAENFRSLQASESWACLEFVRVCSFL